MNTLSATSANRETINPAMLQLVKVERRDGARPRGRVYVTIDGGAEYDNVGEYLAYREADTETVMGLEAKLQPLIEQALRIAGETKYFYGAHWSWHAGCRMCRCSPGFVLSHPRPYYSLFLTVASMPGEPITGVLFERTGKPLV